MIGKQRIDETMAEQWQRQKPATYGRTYYGGKDDHGMTDFMQQLGRIDTGCRLKLVGGGGFTISFSDGSSYRMPSPADRKE